MTLPCISESAEAKVLKSPETQAGSDRVRIQEEVLKYLRFLPQVAEPSLGRVREIQEEVKKGTYLSPEVIEETAARLALRFLRKE